MKTKNTLRALYASIASLIVCMSMLVGSTFAWFTDVANTNVNEIQAGELDVALEMYGDSGWENAEGKTLPFKTADNRAQEKIRWEPGCTYELPALKIVNNGDLAFKYNMYVTGIEGDLELAQVLDVYIKIGDGEWIKDVGTLDQLMSDGDGAAHGILLPKGETVDEKAPQTDKSVTAIGETESYTIALHMKESADNKYQKMRLRNMSFTVYAYQYTFEYDSYDNQYDAPPSTVDGVAANLSVLYGTLQEAIDKGGDAILLKNVVFDASAHEGAANRVYTLDLNTVNNEVTVDLNGKRLSYDQEKGVHSYTDAYMISVMAGGNLTIKNGTIDTEAGTNTTAAITVWDGGKATIESGHYTGMHTVYVHKGTLEIKGGFFELTNTCKQYASQVPQLQKLMINCEDNNYRNGTAKIIVTGGTFVNFNPANNQADGANTNYVAEGYKVVSETQENGEIWYTVVPE